MKWPIFFLSILLIFPTSAWLRRNPEKFRLVWAVFGFLPFGLAAIPQLDIALIDWSGWPGYAKGILYSANDAAALAILFALPKSQRPIPFRTPMLLYFGAVLCSVLHAEVPSGGLLLCRTASPRFSHLLRRGTSKHPTSCHSGRY